jgi:ATP-dependent DNA helicase RecQ
VISDADLHAALRRYWGYDSFRPLQQSVVRSLLDGHDTCVVMPTGGGKSLCYQLPAALLESRTAIVISPLIALMQDQVAQLAQMGIASALLNSSLTGAKQLEVMREAQKGAYRILYLSPERIARQDTLEWLGRVPISFFAIDEAHCISEWGHEFRPDYRQLSSLRRSFPDQAFAAFTASATQRVRHDIIEQLKMREPHKYIASFHRPNLRYVVKQCDARTQSALLITALRRYEGNNVIVYAPTIAVVEQTVEFLKEHGIAALAYHGKMDAATRRSHQESWMSDEVPVLVGTLAFGLGINKAAVRAVIHLSLPKSVEQYYQEAGRAGRDGLAADCLLLWQKRDAALLAHFIKELNDPAETARAWRRYHEIRDFAESKICRHLRICSHFGESPKWASCTSCDACSGLPAWLAMPPGECDDSGPTERSKRRPRQATARPQARPAVAAVFHLRGNASIASPPSQVLPRGLGYRPLRSADVAPATSAASSSSNAGASQGAALRPVSVESSVARQREAGVDPALREYLREWRRNTAMHQGVPAFIVMYDSTLEDVCRIRPDSLAGIRRISGFGERKTEAYGQQILDALQRFRDGARAAKRDPTVRGSRQRRPAAAFARIRKKR